jgi:hypothetical protein
LQERSNPSRATLRRALATTATALRGCGLGKVCELSGDRLHGELGVVVAHLEVRRAP